MLKRGHTLPRERLQSPEWVLSQFQALNTMLNGERNSPFFTRRKDAFDALTERGFPTTSDEDWRHTNMVPTLSAARGLANRVQVTGEELRKLMQEIPARRIVLVNGYLEIALSDLTGLPLKCHSLAEVLSGHVEKSVSELVQRYFSHCAKPKDDSFIALNTSMLRDGVVIQIPKGVKLDSPLHIIHVAVAGERALICPRVLLIAEAESQAEVIEHFVSSTSEEYLSVAVTEVICGENCNLKHYKIQDESKKATHVGMLAPELARDCQFLTFTLNAGGALVRNEIEPVLVGENSSCLLQGLSLADSTQHIDNFTVLDHAKPHCQSTEVFKGIYGGKSEGGFNGTIIVRPGAQKTNAIQSNQSILLSRNASIESKPQLKIWADDVKCTHGATVGELDADALFYLQSRGIGREEARKILVRAFASSLINEISSSEVREFIEGVLERSLASLS